MDPVIENQDWGWWTVFKRLDEFELDLEKLVPNPGKQRLIDLDHEYTPAELRELLQRFGSYLASLHNLEGKIEGQCHALREGFKNGIAIAVANSESKTSTITGKEAEVLASNELFKQTKRMQIDHEATLLVIKGWRQAYEQAWATVSRIISLNLGEVQLQTGRHN